MISMRFDVIYSDWSNSVLGSKDPARNLNNEPFGESLVTKPRDIKVCHAYCKIQIFSLTAANDIELPRNRELADVDVRCSPLRNFPRKPRCCLNEVRADYEWRFSFCCNRCRNVQRCVGTVPWPGVYLGWGSIDVGSRAQQRQRSAAWRDIKRSCSHDPTLAKLVG